jgi:hypothetical protein
MTAYRIIVALTLCGLPASRPAAFGQTAPEPPAEASSPTEGAAPDEPVAKPKPADSNDGRCDTCGSCVCVHKVCVPKPKEREIRKVCWSYKCEDFCIPGPSEYCGTKCQKDRCGWWSFDFWRPTCAEIRTKKVPVKTEAVRKVPGFEWRPEERCAACRAHGEDATCAADSAP